MQTACLITTTIAAIGAINYGFTAIPRSNDEQDCKRNLIFNIGNNFSKKNLDQTEIKIKLLL